MRIQIFRDAVRAKEIVTVLLKYRFDEILRQIETPASWLVKIAPSVKGNVPLWTRIRMAVEELGPTSIKTAQILSTRPDILPHELIEEFKKLRDQVQPLPFDQIQPRLESLLGGKIADDFDDFDPNPVASGSLGQIYRAREKVTGKQVAIKVQRPGIRKLVAADLEIITWFAQQMHQHIAALKPFDLPEVVQELRRGILNELDFRIEARNATLFNALNQNPEQVFAPEVLDEFTDERLLVTEWVDGRVPDVEKLTPEAGKRLARIGGDSFFNQIVLTGFFHADPHTGNILVTEDERICFIDWGLAGQLTREMRHHVIDLFTACQEGNAERVTQIAIRMGRSTRRIDQVRLEKDVTATLFKHSESLKKMDHLGQVIFELIFVFGSNGIHITRDYTLLARAVISIEETAKQLDPEFDLAAVGRPYVREVTWNRWNPFQMTRNIAVEAREKLRILAELPNDLQRLVHRLEDEDLGIQLRHTNLENASEDIHAAFSRLSLAIIIGALLIGSSIVITTGVQPLLWGYPAIGIVGYVLSGLMGLRVAWDIIRHGHNR